MLLVVVALLVLSVVLVKKDYALLSLTMRTPYVAHRDQAVALKAASPETLRDMRSDSPVKKLPPARIQKKALQIALAKPSDVKFLPDEGLRKALRSTKYPNGITARNLALPVHHFRQPKIPEEMAETVADADVAYFIKACRKFSRRSQEIYEAWGKSVTNLIFSTDTSVEGIPMEKQLITSVENSENQKFLKEASAWEARHNIVSCLTTLFNLGKFLTDERFQNVTWLVLLDDDTFAIPKNLMEYLSVFPSSSAWYLGLSNAEIPGMAITGNRLVPVTASAAGVAYSKSILDAMRQGKEGVNFSSASFAQKTCGRSHLKDDVAMGYMPLILYHAVYVARPDLRGYHFKEMADPTDLKPLTVHAELQDHAKDLDHIFKELRKKYEKYF